MKGQYRTSAMAADSCAPCAAGFAQDLIGQASCLPCIPGSYINVTGQESCNIFSDC